MKRHQIAAGIGLWLAMIPAVPSLAQSQSEPVVVVELYTSQGCSSCPPADALLAELTQDARIAPLALHVNYWDYIGWADNFADERYSARQRAYARVAGSRMVYTPQMIVGGDAQVEGNDPAAVVSAINSQLEKNQPIDLALDRHGDKLTIRATAAGGIEMPVSVQLVRYKPQEIVSIEHGENAGKTITYRNIVTQWERVTEWDGTAPLDVDVSTPGDEPAVVILQRSGPSEILAAARLVN